MAASSNPRIIPPAADLARMLQVGLAAIAAFALLFLALAVAAAHTERDRLSAIGADSLPHVAAPSLDPPAQTPLQPAAQPSPPPDALPEDDTATNGTAQALADVATISGIALVALLIATQILLSQRTRRALNPALIAATGLAMLSVLLTHQRLSDASEQARSASGALRAVSSLRQARTTAHDANDDLQRRLLAGKDHRDAFPPAFDEKTARLLRIPEGSIANAVASFIMSANLPEGATGYLAVELKNVAFPGERDAANALIGTFGIYVASTFRLRDQVSGIAPVPTAHLDANANRNSVDASFARFDTVLGRTIDIDQAALNSAIDRGLTDLRPLPRLLAIAIAVVALCTFAGLLPLLRPRRG